MCAGDLARWLPDGTIDFMGRLDNQARRKLDLGSNMVQSIVFW